MIDLEKFFREHPIDPYAGLPYSVEQQRSRLAAHALELYAKEYADRFGSTGADESITDEDLADLITIFLKPAYVAPNDDFNEMQIHLQAMKMLFERLAPFVASSEQMLQLDIAFLKLIASAAAQTVHEISEAARKRKVTAGKGNQGRVSCGRVAAAYRKIEPQPEWKGEIPYINGGKIPLSGLADLVRDEMKKAGIKALDAKTVISYLKELKAKGKI